LLPANPYRDCFAEGTDRPVTARHYSDICNRMIEFLGRDEFVESITREEYAEWQLTANAVSSLFRNIRVKANLPARMNVNAHALRHRFAQTMLDDFDARTVSQWMGIEVKTLMEIYAYRSEDELMRKRFGEVPPD
jgi:integrase